MGTNCFEALNEGKDTENVKLVPQVDEDDKDGNANVIQIGIVPGSFCYFESSSDFMIEGEEPLSIFYFLYEGYTPGIKANRYWKQTCKFIETNHYYVGAIGQWFYPNGFGGSCKYMILIGIDEIHEDKGVKIVKIYEKYNTDLRGAGAVQLLSSLSAAILFLSYISLY